MTGWGNVIRRLLHRDHGPNVFSWAHFDAHTHPDADVVRYDEALEGRLDSARLCTNHRHGPAGLPHRPVGEHRPPLDPADAMRLRRTGWRYGGSGS